MLNRILEKLFPFAKEAFEAQKKLDRIKHIYILSATAFPQFTDSLNQRWYWSTLLNEIGQEFPDICKQFMVPVASINLGNKDQILNMGNKFESLISKHKPKPLHKKSFKSKDGYEQVKKLIAEGKSIKEAVKIAGISMGYYYILKKKEENAEK